jgi:hypothetical protein
MQDPMGARPYSAFPGDMPLDFRKWVLGQIFGNFSDNPIFHVRV